MSKVVESVEIMFIDGADVPIKHKHADRMVVMRDAADPDGDALYYTANEWEAFILGVKDGEFDDMAAEPDTPDTDTPGNQETKTFPWTGRPAITGSEQTGV